MKLNYAFQNQQSGVSLIEALVATLILGIAVLGYAGLEVTGLDITNEAFLRERGTYLAVEAKERIRMNRSEEDAYLNHANWTAGPALCNSELASCTRLRDISELMSLAQEYLPNGKLGIDSTCGVQKCIVVSWSGAASNSCEADGNCIELVAYDF